MTNAKLLFIVELQEITAICVKHFPDLGNDDVEISLEIDIGWQIAGEPVNYRLARLVHA
jgi:hypothetical protein